MRPDPSVAERKRHIERIVLALTRPPFEPKRRETASPMHCNRNALTQLAVAVHHQMNSDVDDRAIL